MTKEYSSIRGSELKETPEFSLAVIQEACLPVATIVFHYLLEPNYSLLASIAMICSRRLVNTSGLGIERYD